MDDNAREPQVDPVDAWLASVSDDSPASEPAADGGPSATLLDALSAADGPTGDAAAEEVVEPSRNAEAARPQQRYVLFTVAGATYAIQDAFVVEVGRVPATTLVPRTPPWLRGVTSVRGDIVSVIDLRTFLGLEPTVSHTARLLVVRLLGEEFSTGLMVDAIDQIASIPLDAVRPPASRLEGALADFLTGACHVADRFVAVLDIERLLRSPDIRQFDDGKDTKREERSCEARI